MKSDRHNIAGWVRRWARIQPDREAVITAHETLGWGDLERRIEAWAAALIRFGVTPGDRVGCLARNRHEFLELFFATLRIGAIFVPYNVRLTTSELGHAVRDSDPAIVFTHAAFADVAVPAAAQTYVTWVDLDGDVPGLTPLAELVDWDAAGPAVAPVVPEDPALIIYTSGTTGLPKGAVLTHHNIEQMAMVWIIDIGLGHDDRHLVYLPLSFAGGLLGQAMNPVRSGATIVLHDGFDPDQLLEKIEEHRITWTTGVPYTFQLLLESPRFATADLSSMSKAMVGAAPPPVEVIRGFQARGIDIVHSYGLTEGTGGANLQLGVADSVRKLGAMGVATSGGEVRIVGDDGREVRRGEVGELQIRGALVFAGYWRNPEATTAAFTHDGWLHTKDLVFQDEEGYYFTAGRRHDLIVSGGLNVYAAEVEAALESHPAVLHVAVAGVPDDRWQEAVCAFVVPRAGMTATLDDLRAFCRGRLADYRIPKRLVVLDELPRTSSGKVQKHRLPGVGA